MSQDRVLAEQASQAIWRPVGTRTPGDVGELQVQEAGLPWSLTWLVAEEEAVWSPYFSIHLLSALLHPSELWPFWL